MADLYYTGRLFYLSKRIYTKAIILTLNLYAQNTY